MSDFQTTILEPGTLDPGKRVNYLTGLVLGVDELRQEQTYFIERDRLHQRALHGYGTVHGLRVTVPPVVDVLGPEVRVSPGMAVDPHGQHVCVGQVQCARVNAWLNTHRDEIVERIGGSPPGALSIYLVLCYRECETDNVPLPGGPCRSQDDTMAASRLADGFELLFALDAPAPASPVEDPWVTGGSGYVLPTRPPHGEEAGVRAFGALLAQFEVSDGPGPFVTDDDVVALVRGLLPPGGDGAPPGPWLLAADEAAHLLRTAFRIWITEVRPTLLGGGRCGTAPPGDDCVLLAELRFEIVEDAAGLRVRTEGLAEPIEVVEDARPLLYASRLLQELLLGPWGVLAGPGSPPEGSPPEGPASPPGEIVLPPLIEADLTTILGLSWSHDAPSEAFVPVALSGGDTAPALVVVFGQAAVGDRRVRVAPGSLDENSFQVFLREPDQRGFWYPRAVRPRRVVPVEAVMGDGGRVTAATETGGPLAAAAAFVVDERTLDAIGNEQVDVVVRGDFVLDERGRAIDAHHLRGALARESRYGLQGGRFESWFTRIAARIDLNLATAEELQRLPRVGPALAERIVETREAMGGFTAPEDLLDVEGIGEYLLGVLRPFVSVS